jgi:putative protease
MPIKPEIMSPAGYYPQLHAAIEAGADAVYFGLRHFSARAKVGFTPEELPDVMRTLHQRGVKGYVTFNTLVFDSELRSAVRAIEHLAEAGADAIIVQDVGIAQLAHQIAPDLDVHGSTQMSITSAEGVALAQRFGVKRAVLARELSLDNIREIRAQTDCELEIFVHGALCVSYSGQCFSSEAWGGRSANRGQCAQACRLPYEMVVDDVLTPLGDSRYLLSPGDLYALHQVPDIIDIGITTLKIEGRYKDENYVALTTRAYREAVDKAWAGRTDLIAPEDELALEQVYSRGMGAYFISGVNHQEVVQGRAPRHRGILVGRVKHVQHDHVIVEPTEAHNTAPLKAGDGVVFDAADWRSPEVDEEGGHIYGVKPHGKHTLKLTFGNRDIDFGRIRAGDWVWRTHDVDVAKLARPFTQANAPVHTQAVNVDVIAHAGAPLVLTWHIADKPDLQVSVVSDEALGIANKRPLTADYLHQQLGRLGNTAYHLHEVRADMDGNPFIPSSLLNRLRREAIEQLADLQAQAPQRTIHDGEALLEEALARTHISAPDDATSDIALHLLVRTPEQLDAAIDLAPASITLDYLELYGLRPSVERVQEAGINVRVASPRILKPAEQRIVNFLLRLDCDLVVRSGGLLEALQGRHPHNIVGDFSLNVANQLSAETYRNLGVSRITPTHDLNGEQITTLADEIGGGWLEVIAYSHLPVFHTEHCVFCRFLSDGTDHTNCGHPCEKHQVAVRDQQGRAHPVMADVGCRNTVFGAEAQVASQHLDSMMAHGIRHYRLEFVHESADDVRHVTQAFQAYFNGDIESAELDQRLKQIAPQGITEGSFFVPMDSIS